MPLARPKSGIFLAFFSIFQFFLVLFSFFKLFLALDSFFQFSLVSFSFPQIFPSILQFSCVLLRVLEFLVFLGNSSVDFELTLCGMPMVRSPKRTKISRRIKLDIQWLFQLFVVFVWIPSACCWIPIGFFSHFPVPHYLKRHLLKKHAT